MLRRYVVIPVLLLFGCVQSEAMEKHRINILYESPELSSEKVEAEIVVPIEKTIESLRRIELISSAAMNGRAEIEVVFSSSKTGEDILRLIKDMLAKKQGELPQNLEAPRIFVEGGDNGRAK